MSAFVAALRISCRGARRFKGRTALIMVMIGLPVLLITGVLTGWATLEVNDREDLAASLGSADARIGTEPHQRVAQDFRRIHPEKEERAADSPWTTAQIAALVKGRIVPYDKGSVKFLTGDGYDEASAIEVDLRDPMARGMRPLVQGRYPASPDEVVVTPALLERGVKLGGTISVTLGRTQVRVVGVVAYPNRPAHTEMAGFRGVLLLDKRNGSGTGWLVDATAPLDWPQIQRLNGHGLVVHARAVVENPPSDPHYEIPDGDGPIMIALAVVFIVMETVLLAGPAFAVGLRRRRRELAVIAAQGGSGRHLRAIVLADGLVIGGAAALAGAVFGVGGALAVAPLAGQWTGTLGPVEVPWAAVAGVAALGVVSGLIAAVVPAVQAARQSPAQVLAGREGTVRDRAGRPVLGLACVALGMVVTWLSLRGDGSLTVAAVGLVVLGLVALMPWLVRRTGRLAHRLPLPLRLSVRDASRHRSRTASAAAAVMAVTTMAVAFSIGLTGAEAGHEAAHFAQVPTGTVEIGAFDLDDQGWAELKTAAQKEMKGARLVAGQAPTDAQGRELTIRLVPDCDVPCQVSRERSEPLVGDTRLLAFIQGRPDGQAATALAAGTIVVFAPDLIKNGMATVELDPAEGTTDPRPAPKQVPAVLATPADPRVRGAVIPPAALTSLGLRAKERRLYTMHDPANLAQVHRNLTPYAERIMIRAETGPDEAFTQVGLPILLGIATMLVLGGTLAATGLATADMRRDLDTMSATGAPPRIRRLVVAGHAGYVAGLGVAVGTVAGLVAGIALSWPMGYETSFHAMESLSSAPGPTTIEIPWLFIAAFAFGVPLLTALVAGGIAGTRRVVGRRLI
ncbi:FtsX-like permease family protein [Nonomuraea zeae]|uniref:FtsX-like permease family protein n=1 Tax=Nonomuraea zeae TaxID=1642303 RepID=A0A5S4GVG1_9ACTN|nr:FtsX-like permease family protein [Nonomuraea zeae]TMR36945.1 FtsX-like permease family protein [Nonomuraea zeae]